MAYKKLAVLLAVVSQTASSGGADVENDFAAVKDDVQAYSDVFNDENTGYAYGDSTLGGNHWFVFNKDYSCAYKADDFSDERVTCQDHATDNTITVYFSEASKAEVVDKVLSASMNEIAELSAAYAIVASELAQRNQELDMCERGHAIDPYIEVPSRPQAVIYQPVFHQDWTFAEGEALTF